jgi:hypothetical protein
LKQEPRERDCAFAVRPILRKIAKGLRLGYYRGPVAGSWIARYYRGSGVYASEAIGVADDTLEADGVSVLDY